MMANIEKGEEKLAKHESITKLLAKKVSQYSHPEVDLTITYLSTQKGLLCCASLFGGSHDDTFVSWCRSVQ